MTTAGPVSTSNETLAAEIRNHLSGLHPGAAERKFVMWLGAGVAADEKLPDWATLNGTLLQRLMHDYRVQFKRAASFSATTRWSTRVVELRPTYRFLAELEWPKWHRLDEYLADGFGQTPQELQNLVAAVVDECIRLNTRSTVPPSRLLKARRAELEAPIRKMLTPPARGTGRNPTTLAAAVANVMRKWPAVSEVITTNFDTLVERYLTVGAPSRVAGDSRIFHIHGVVTPARAERNTWRSEELRGLILSDSDFGQFATSGDWEWAEKRALRALTSDSCLFVGTSMSDPNLLRWLSSVRPQGRGRPAYKWTPDTRQKPLRLALIARAGWRVRKDEHTAYEHHLRMRWWSHLVRLHIVDEYAQVKDLIARLAEPTL